MALATFARETLTIRRAAVTTDPYGREVKDWPNATDTPVEDCSFQPIAGSETFDASGEQVVSRWRAAFPGHPDVRNDDRIVHGGTVYDIDGEPRVWQSPTGRKANTELTVKRVS